AEVIAHRADRVDALGGSGRQHMRTGGLARVKAGASHDAAARVRLARAALAKTVRRRAEVPGALQYAICDDVERERARGQRGIGGVRRQRQQAAEATECAQEIPVHDGWSFIFGCLTWRTRPV